jgi:hypothetical protein
MIKADDKAIRGSLHLYFIYIQNREKLFIEKDELF